MKVVDLIRELQSKDPTMEVSVCMRLEETGEAFYYTPTQVSVDEPGEMGAVVAINIVEEEEGEEEET